MPAPARERIGVRIPTDLLSKLQAQASEEDRSLSYIVVKLLEAAYAPKPRARKKR